MNRLKKKCVITAAGVHLLLLVILIVGPAFLASKDEANDLQVLEFVPMMTTDKPFQGGGNPKAAPPPPPQAPPQPPEPRKATPPPEPPKKDTQAVEPEPEKKRRIEVSTRLVSRSDVKSTSKPRTTTEDKANAERANAFKTAAGRLRSDLSSSTEVDIPGPGGGGPTYARFKDALYTAYMNAWILPNDLEADAPSVATKVVIARDGTVLSARITKSSGIPSLDRSVQDALDRVKSVPPPPEGSPAERPCNINFNPLAKQSLG